ncbi:MAG: M16 family metallopeptidase [Acidobacteriota bacterium]
MSSGSSTSASAPVRFDASETVLSNGLRLVMLEDHATPLISYQVHYAAGSRNERPGITGISHLFEHMMFKGTPKVGPEEFARTIQARGGQLNAFTTCDNTSYYENLPSDCLDLAIRLESDRQANLLLTEENLASEREVVRNERLFRTVNTPYGLVQEELMSLAFSRHPYSWPVVGWDSDLVAMTLDDCRNYFFTFYAPNNATVVVVGDFDSDVVQRLVEDAYGVMKPGPRPPDVVTFEEPQHGERRGVYRKTLEAAALFAGFHIPGVTHADTFPLVILASILSTGQASRFHRRFVATGRAAAVKASVGFSFLNRDPSLFNVSAVAHPRDDIAGLEADIWEEIDRLHQTPPDTREVKRATKQMVASFVLQAQNNCYRGLQLGLFQIRADGWEMINRLVESYRSVTAGQVQDVARRYLVADNRSVVLAEPA